LGEHTSFPDIQRLPLLGYGAKGGQFLMKVSKGDAVTYVALVTSAALQAAEPLRKEAATPPDLHPILSSSIWAYLPLALLTLVFAIWLYRQIFAKPANDPKLEREKPVEAVAPTTKKPAICSFGPMRWEQVGLDPGEDHGGKQLFFRLYIPVVFNRNAPSTTARISVLRRIDPGFRKLGLIPDRPLYVWRPFEQKNFLAGDIENIVIAAIAENRQHHGYYGDLRSGAGYISSGTKHLFEIKILSDSDEEKHEIYIEYSHDQIYASGSFPGDLGEFAGKFIVIQEGTDVFKAKWIEESRAAL
jgi:hypothetical protein